MNLQRGIAPFILIIIVVAILSVGADIFVFPDRPEPISLIVKEEQKQKEKQEIKTAPMLTPGRDVGTNNVGKETEKAPPKDDQANFPEDLAEPQKVTEPVKEDIQEFLSPPVFTHHIIVLSDYQSLTPPGSVSADTFAPHGYLKLKEGIRLSPIYAPIDAEIAGIAYYSYVDQYVPESKMYDISLIVNKNVDLFIGSIAELAPKLKAVAPQQPQASSASLEPTEPTSVKAGELLGYVNGWDFGAYDKTNQNIVANIERHRSKWDDSLGQYVEGVCPYNYYPDDMKQEYLNLMVGKKCPNSSRDVPGTAAGYWFANKTFHVVDDDYFYVDGESPRFVIAKKEDGGVQWAGFGSGTDETNVGASPTDPADLSVGDSFCYKNDRDWIDTGKNYLFIKLLPEAELALFYGEGTCPTSFPEEGYQVYIR